MKPDRWFSQDQRTVFELELVFSKESKNQFKNLPAELSVLSIPKSWNWGSFTLQIFKTLELGFSIMKVFKRPGTKGYNKIQQQPNISKCIKFNIAKTHGHHLRNK
jgi:hypothetical protein